MTRRKSWLFPPVECPLLFRFPNLTQNLGVTLDCHLSLKTHVLNVVRTASFELRRISSIRRLLTTEVTATLVSAFILSRLDYCKGHATRNDIVDDIVDFSSSTMAFNVAKIASARASLTISLTKSLRVAGLLLSPLWLPPISDSSSSKGSE